MRPRHVIAAAGLALVALVGLVGGTAAAQTTPPLTCTAATAAEVKAAADLTAALPALLDFNPNVYPGDKVPTVEALPRLLDDILADPDLGGEARALVNTAVKLRAALTAATAARVTACAPPTTTPNPPTTTPNPPTTTPNPPTTTPPPANDIDCVDVTRAAAQRILDANRADPNNLDSDNDGTACEEGEPLPSDNDAGDQFDYVPDVSDGIATGGR